MISIFFTKDEFPPRDILKKIEAMIATTHHSKIHLGAIFAPTLSAAKESYHKTRRDNDFPQSVIVRKHKIKNGEPLE